MSAGRVILIVLGSIGVLLGLALLAGGGFLLWADRTQREDGYLTTPTERFATPTYALTRTRLEVDTDGAGWILNDSWFGKVRIRGESAGGKTLFMGIGPEAAVAKYLGPVAHANVEEIDFDPFRVTYLPVTGGTPQGPPTEQRFWAASASGVGTQTLTWKVREGDWSVVLMNSDGSRGVAANIDVGAKMSFLLWVAVGGPPRRRARHRGKCRIGRPCRADAPATASATRTSHRGRRIRRCAGSRAFRPVNRTGPA